jgi:Malectin domain
LTLESRVEETFEPKQYITVRPPFGTAPTHRALLCLQERWGLDMKYAIPIANGSYKVTLHFAELLYVEHIRPRTAHDPCASSQSRCRFLTLLLPFSAGAASVGGRVFKATLESGGPNAVTSADIDIYKAVGAMFTAHTVTLAVTVSDGVLNVAFLLGAANNPQLCGIEIQKA